MSIFQTYNYEYDYGTHCVHLFAQIPWNFFQIHQHTFFLMQLSAYSTIIVFKLIHVLMVSWQAKYAQVKMED